MKRFLLMLATATLLVGCASTPAVYTDYDPGVSFSEYRTYRWSQKPEGLSPLMDQRVVASIDAKLRERGWTQSANPQVDLVGKFATETRYRMDSYNYGPAWGGWGWAGDCCWGHGWGGWGGYSTSNTLRSYTHGELILDMTDAQTKRPLWRGIALGTISDSPVAQTTAMQDSVERMFAQFPPSAVAQVP